MIAQPYLIAFDKGEAQALLNELEDLNPSKLMHPLLDELLYELKRNLAAEENG